MREVHVLDALRGDVLALRELEDVFDAVDDREAPAPVHLANVPRAEPAVRQHRLGRLLRAVEVSLKERMASQQELAARVRRIRDQVFHIGHAGETDFHRRGDGAAVAGREVAGQLAETDSVGFGQAVALQEVVPKHDAEELVERGVERRGAGDHGCGALEAEGRGHFAAPEAVVNGVFVCRGGGFGVLEGLKLGGDDVPGQGAAEAGLVGCCCADGAAEAVVEARDGVEGGGAEKFEVFDE